jgi:hypothetical protein
MGPNRILVQLLACGMVPPLGLISPNMSMPQGSAYRARSWTGDPAEFGLGGTNSADSVLRNSVQNDARSTIYLHFSGSESPVRPNKMVVQIIGWNP